MNNFFNLNKNINRENCNLKMSTLGGTVFWKNIAEKGNYVVQKNIIDGHCRILDESDYRVAWGSESEMLDKLERLTSLEFLIPGDVIGISRGIAVYEHYGIYIGNNEVIHFSTKEGEILPSIHQASLEEFIKKGIASGACDTLFVVKFYEDKRPPVKLYINSSDFNAIINDIANSIIETMLRNPYKPTNIPFFKLITNELENYHLYSPEETIERAKSRLGEKGYNLIFKNCEHFAVWCKTGISKSYQVNQHLLGLYQNIR